MIHTNGLRMMVVFCRTNFFHPRCFNIYFIFLKKNKYFFFFFLFKDACHVVWLWQYLIDFFFFYPYFIGWNVILKWDTLNYLMHNHPGEPCLFVEDRLDTLIKVHDRWFYDLVLNNKAHCVARLIVNIFFLTNSM